jgi:hypothetical protein
MPPKTTKTPQSTKPADATLLKADFWLQHVTDTSNDDADSDYSAFWLAQTGQKWPEFCCLCGSEPPTCGAHMFSIRADLAGVVIVPACAACNNNVSKGAKYASTKFNVWAAHVSAHEQQRIERRQRQTERHLRAEARIDLIQTLPPAGVPIPISVHARKKYVPRFCIPPGGDAADDDEDLPRPERTPTPLPPSPVPNPELPAASFFQVQRVSLGPRPKPPKPTAAVAAAVDEYKRIVAAADDDDDEAATPRPVRRRERAPLRKSTVIDALREVNRCKQPIENDSKFCNSTVCSKLKCSGSSKVYCCAHCGCLGCVKSTARTK